MIPGKGLLGVNNPLEQEYTSGKEDRHEICDLAHYLSFWTRSLSFHGAQGLGLSLGQLLERKQKILFLNVYIKSMLTIIHLKANHVANRLTQVRRFKQIYFWSQKTGLKSLLMTVMFDLYRGWGEWERMLGGWTIAR